MKTKLKGFTLVELVITIAIVIILSVISVPIYRGYVDKAKMSEGYAFLGVILSAQKAYYSEYGHFYNSNTGDPEDDSFWGNYNSTLGIDARGNKYFTKFHIGSNVSLEKDYFDAIIKKVEELRDNGKNELAIIYNITSGATIREQDNDR